MLWKQSLMSITNKGQFLGIITGERRLVWRVFIGIIIAFVFHMSIKSLHRLPDIFFFLVKQRQKNFIHNEVLICPILFVPLLNF